MVQRLAAVVFCLGLLILPATALAQTPDSAPEAMPNLRLPSTSLLDAPAVSPFQSADWQSEFDTAQRRKKSGMKKMLIGGAASTLGAAIYLTKGTDDVITSGDTSSFNFGILVSLAGTGVFTWGAIEYFDARGDIASLESRRPRNTGASFALSENQSVAVTTGATKSLQYRVSW